MSLFDELRRHGELPFEQARMLPLAAYGFDDMLERELIELFGNDWLCVGRTIDVPRVGDYLTAEIPSSGGGHRSLIVIRADDGELGRSTTSVSIVAGGCSTDVAPRSGSRARTTHGCTATTDRWSVDRTWPTASKRTGGRSTRRAIASANCERRSGKGSCSSASPPKRRD